MRTTYHVMAQYRRRGKPTEVSKFTDEAEAQVFAHNMQFDDARPRVWIETIIEALDAHENAANRQTQRELAQ